MPDANAPGGAIGAGDVPVINLSELNGSAAQRIALAKRVDAACRDFGFLVIVNHGIDPALVAAVDKAGREFFALPHGDRMAAARHKGGISRGYTALRTRALARTLGDAAAAGDLRETFTMGPPRGDPDDSYYCGEIAEHLFLANVFPAAMPDMPPLLERYYAAMSELAERIMRLFALALKLDEGYFTSLIGRHVSSLSLVHYPELESMPEPGQMRAGPHTDFGTLTILRAEDRPGGLEIQTASGVWAKVPIAADGFVINIGDLMARWTNDRWRSTLHRVTAPPLDAPESTQRLSIVFFHQPDHDATIACLPGCVGEGARYAPTTSGQHMLEKMCRSRMG